MVQEIKVLHFVLLGQNIILLKHEAFPGISIFDIKKDSFSHDIIRGYVTLP